MLDRIDIISASFDKVNILNHCIECVQIEGGIWVLFASVPDHCIPVTSTMKPD